MDLPAIRAVADRPTHIYVLCETDLTPRYVGKTVQTIRGRLTRHFSSAKRKKLPVERWVAKRGRSGVVCKIIEIVPPHEDWAEREQYWIKRFKNETAPLLNLTAGGEGHLGRKKSNEEIEKIASKLRTGRNVECLNCSISFWVKPHMERGGNGKYCSRECYHTHGNSKPKAVSDLTVAAGKIATKLRFAKQTHCKRGHLLSGVNVYRNPAGRRVCKSCRKIHKNNHRARS